MKIGGVFVPKIAQNVKFDEIRCLKRFRKAKSSYLHQILIKKWPNFDQTQNWWRKPHLIGTYSTSETVQSLCQRIDGLHIEVIGRFVHNYLIWHYIKS